MLKAKEEHQVWLGFTTYILIALKLAYNKNNCIKLYKTIDPEIYSIFTSLWKGLFGNGLFSSHFVYDFLFQQKFVLCKLYSINWLSFIAWLTAVTSSDIRQYVYCNFCQPSSGCDVINFEINFTAYLSNQAKNCLRP